MREMRDTKVISKKYTLRLDGWCGYDNNNDDTEVFLYLEDIKNAKVGQIWEAKYYGNCGRDCHNEEAKVIYKDDTGAGILITYTGTTDSPNPKPYENRELLWIEF